jgi:hypothetical protein
MHSIFSSEALSGLSEVSWFEILLLWTAESSSALAVFVGKDTIMQHVKPIKTKNIKPILILLKCITVIFYFILFMKIVSDKYIIIFFSKIQLDYNGKIHYLIFPLIYLLCFSPTIKGKKI